MQVAIIGGGAAGFFAAISCKTNYPDAKVTIYEKSDKLLAKVKISGGGRCNVTHACYSISQLSRFYPRGEKQLKKAFEIFNTNDTVEWFESRGVKLKTEADNRMFPISNNSQTIIDCLMFEVQKLGIVIKTHHSVFSIKKVENKFSVLFSNENVIQPDKIIVASGGSPKLSGFNWLESMGHVIEPPVPSLFTFNMPNEPIKELMGISVNNAIVKIQGHKLKQEGAVLITHWGMSGPAILKLSAWGARILHNMNYCFKIQVNWQGIENEEQLRTLLIKNIDLHPKRKIANENPFQLPLRLWLFLLHKAGLPSDGVWGNTGKSAINKLVNTLLNDEYQVEGKTTFKEEFVTCGGVSLDSVSLHTMESKTCPGLFFAGEVLDIDGITGGFNFQAAWTTGYISGKLGV